MKENVLSFVLVVISMLMSQSILGKDDEKLFYNSLFINGKPLVNEPFSISSKGILTMVMSDSKTKDTKTIPFKVYLKRQDNLVPLGGTNYSNELLQIEVSQILKFANLGDQLIIEPVNRKSQMSTQVIILRESYFLEFLNRGGKRDGC
jgi:hypothetical protein